MQKKAILIGNGSYQNLPPLDTPSNDVTVLGETLEKYGFEVTIYIDVAKDGVGGIVDKFKTFHDIPGIYILYYSGHGFSDGGVNYITSIDSDSACLCYESDSVDRFFCESDKSVSIMFIDACRKSKESVFRELKSRSVLGPTVNSNMVEQYIPDNTIICFSTSFGYAADDNFEDSGLSPYAYFLNNNLKHFSSDIYTLLNKTRIDVSRGTNNKQIPIELTSLKKYIEIYDNRDIPSFINLVQKLIFPSPACAAHKTFPSFLWGSGPLLLGIMPVQPIKGISVQLKDANLISDDDSIESIAFNDYGFAIGTHRGKIIFTTPDGLVSRDVIGSAIFDIKISKRNDFCVISSNEGVFIYNKDFQYIISVNRGYSYSLELSKDDSVIYFYSEYLLLSYDIQIGSMDIIYEPDGRGGPHVHIYAIRKVDNMIICATTKGLLLFDEFSKNVRLLSFTKNDFPGFVITKNTMVEWTENVEEIEYRCLDVSPCRNYVACGTSDGIIVIWDINHEFTVKFVTGSVIRQEVTSIAWGFMNNIIAIINSEMLIEIIPSQGINYMHPIKDECVNGITNGSEFDDFGGVIYSSPVFIK